jgi:hypothetical protein
MKIRYREQKRFMRSSVMVLQVGNIVSNTYYDPNDPMGGSPPGWCDVRVSWRDATASDLYDLGNEDD